MKTNPRAIFFAVFCFSVLTPGCAPQEPSSASDVRAVGEAEGQLAPHQQLARDIYQQLIEIDTTPLDSYPGRNENFVLVTTRIRF